MDIPTIPRGKNKYYDLGPVRQFDVEVIRNALRYYAENLSEQLGRDTSDSDERFLIAAMRTEAVELSERYNKQLPIYE